VVDVGDDAEVADVVHGGALAYNGALQLTAPRQLLHSPAISEVRAKAPVARGSRAFCSRS